MSVKVIYATETFLSKSDGRPGVQSERVFGSVEEAKAASMPDGVTFAYIPVEGCRHVYSYALGWQWESLEEAE